MEEIRRCFPDFIYVALFSMQRLRAASKMPAMLRLYSANVLTAEGEKTFDFEATSDRDASYIAGKYIRRRIDDLGLDDRVCVIGPNGTLIETTTVEKLARRAE